jgi:hypothetical protein
MLKSSLMPAIFAIMIGALLAPAEADTRQAVAFLGFDLINTSLEATSVAETNRLQDLDTLFQQKLNASSQYSIVPLAPDLKAELGRETDIRNCNGCERDIGKKAGAGLVAWGTVQKVSDLILNINLYMEDVASGQVIFVKSVDIRGNTDQSWQRGLTYLLRNYLLHLKQ